ncbi:MAG: RepB family plasmid replication initiator protein [Verrucomicrobiaceae bacterium]|nr:MAG: RepB family plasmid replication initiator protein [Verrucomicrobiaceae bacterium]
MTPDTSKSPQQLKKHVSTVKTSAPLTLLQRKSFSVLVFAAYPELLTKRVHEIPVSLFCDLVGFNSHDTGLLEESLTQLAKTAINWEDGEGKKRKWAVTTFLSFASIERGVCRYEFSEFLARELYQPEIYARISIGSLRDFETKHGLALYENCARYRPNADFRGGTPEWPLDLFRRLMGVEGLSLYSDFKRINERIIKPAVAEVNSLSDIAVEPRFRKKGRSVVAVAFGVRDNGRLKLAADSPSVAHPLALEAKERYAVPLLKAAEWLEAHGEERFREVLQMTAQLVASGKAKSPVGFMRKALEENYTLAPDGKEIRKKELAARKTATHERRTVEQQLKADKAEAERVRLQEEQLAATAIARFESLPAGEQQEIVETLSAENSFFRDRYARQGKEKLLTGTLRLVLVHWLEEKWSLHAGTQ